MFKTLGLFTDTRCPDSSCHRPQCVFAHGQPSRSTLAASARLPSATSPARAKQPTPTLIRTSAAASGSTKNRIPSGIRDAVADQSAIASSGKLPLAKEKPQAVLSKSAKQAPPPTKPSVAPSRPQVRTASATASTPAHIPSTAGTLPQLPWPLKTSPQPFVDRQKGSKSQSYRVVFVYA